MIRLWLFGLLRHRLGRLGGVAAGVAVTVALLATLSMFLANSSVSMTRRAVSAVPIDWQVEAVPGADLGKIHEAIAKAAPATAIQEVHYANVAGLEANAGGTVQTTGPGKVIAFDNGYLKEFPVEVRLLSGRIDGVLLAQQTASNLHVAPGDTISIKRIGMAAETVKVDGVVDLPDADALFQAVGLPPQAAPQAPPDNVVILPVAQWQRIFAPQQALRPDTVRTQFHVRLDPGALPSRPTEAWTRVAGEVKNLEARVAGEALVANNLGARLDAVRGDALYATVLFLFLGVPGVTLAAILTFAVTSTGKARRQAEQALLRIRGASVGRILALQATEALLVGIVGAAGGVTAALLFASSPLDTIAFGTLSPLVLSVLAGLLLALAAYLYPAWRDLRGRSVSAARRAVGRAHMSLWKRLWLDVLLLAGSLLLFWQLSSTGYQVVLAPEGVPATAVDYNAFLAPTLFWIGAVLLTIRLCGTVIATNGRTLQALLHPVAGRLTPIVSAALSQQTGRITTGIAMTALAVSFALSTAVFNTTYNAQARVDAELTNGADVTVFGTTTNPAGAKLDLLAALPGVKGIQPMQHRFAYVGADLQDLYGIEPKSLGKATSLSDAYFSGGSASDLLAKLAATPNGVLVSEETVRDFQLAVGDTINLRLMNAADHQYHPVPFTFIGVAREFPTAPKDSFLVANASYIAQATGSTANEYVLMKSATDPALLARAAAKALAADPGLQVKDVGSVAHLIGSSLTAVDLAGLTKIELTFALGMAVAAAGLMLGLGFVDRRRGFAILSAIGAKPRQIAAFLWGEGLLIALGGLVFGGVTGLTMAWMLVKLLTGVFDPPPETLTFPMVYLVALLALLLLSIAVAVVLANLADKAREAELLREL